MILPIQLKNLCLRARELYDIFTEVCTLKVSCDTIRSQIRIQIGEMADENSGIKGRHLFETVGEQ